MRGFLGVEVIGAATGEDADPPPVGILGSGMKI